MNSEKEKQFLAAFDNFSDEIFRYCYFKTKDRDVAKDMLQEIFLKTWSYLSKAKEIENIRAFLYRLAHNIVVDWYRKKKPLSLEVLGEDGFDPADPRQKTNQYAEVEEAMALLSRLAEEDKELITLRYVNELSPKEIGLLKNERENTISVKLHRALKRFRDLVE